MDGYTILFLISIAMLVMAVAQALYLVTIEIIEDIERRKRWRRRRQYTRGSARVRSTGMWRDIS